MYACRHTTQHDPDLQPEISLTRISCISVAVTQRSPSGGGGGPPVVPAPLPAMTALDAARTLVEALRGLASEAAGTAVACAGGGIKGDGAWRGAPGVPCSEPARLPPEAAPGEGEPADRPVIEPLVSLLIEPLVIEPLVSLRCSRKLRARAGSAGARGGGVCVCGGGGGAWDGGSGATV